MRLIPIIIGARGISAVEVRLLRAKQVQFAGGRIPVKYARTGVDLSTV
jgi:hypothetical protein